MAAALQQRTSATDLADVTRHFGIVDIGEIVARITRGLLRAAALEARLISHPIREPAAPDTLTAPSARLPRAAQPEDESAGAGEPCIARLPTPGDIAAEIRRRPAGAVLADICRDLGIVPSNPLWREISAAIISYGGNLAALLGDIVDRHGLADPPAHRGATRGTGTEPAIHGDARHRPALNLDLGPSRRHARGRPTAGPAALVRPTSADARRLASARRMSAFEPVLPSKDRAKPAAPHPTRSPDVAGPLGQFQQRTSAASPAHDGPGPWLAGPAAREQEAIKRPGGRKPGSGPRCSPAAGRRAAPADSRTRYGTTA